MKSIQKVILLGVALTCTLAPLLRPETAYAQTTMQSVQGNWVGYAGGGYSKTVLQFNANGTYHVAYEDASRNKISESGQYGVIAQTVVTTSSAGIRSKLFFFWINANMATIRVVPDGSAKGAEATFTRVR